MKKKYTSPEVNAVYVSASEIICVSATFGEEETTDVMHAKRQTGFLDDGDDDPDE